MTLTLSKYVTLRNYFFTRHWLETIFSNLIVNL